MENEFLIFNCSISENRSVDLSDLPKIMSTLNINVQNTVNYNFMEGDTLAVNSNDSPGSVDYTNLETSSDCYSPTSPNSPSTSQSSLRSSSGRMRRASYQSALHKVKRRVISKPKKVLNFSNENDVRNYYFNNKALNNYKPSPLETIFEESTGQPDADGAIINLSKNISNLIGKRKLKRSIAFTDCLNVPRSIIANRRKRVKRLLGRNMKLEKLSMDAFLKHIKSLGYGLNPSTSADKDAEQPPHEIESDIEFVTANERFAVENDTVFAKSNEI